MPCLQCLIASGTIRRRNIRDERRHQEGMIFDENHLQKIQSQRRESPEIEALIRQRNELLQEYPHLQGLQQEIDTVLATTLDPLERSEIIFMLISDKLVELMGVYRDLSKLTGQVISQ